MAKSRKSFELWRRVSAGEIHGEYFLFVALHHPRAHLFLNLAFRLRRAQRNNNKCTRCVGNPQSVKKIVDIIISTAFIRLGVLWGHRKGIVLNCDCGTGC